MAYKFERSIVIGAPPEQVFDYLLDIPSHMEWGEMSDLEILYQGPLQIGSRWRSSGTTSNIQMHDECTIVALERPRLFSFRARSQTQMGVGEQVLSYRLEPVPGGTRVTFSRDEALYEEMPPVYRAIFTLPGIGPGIMGLMDSLITRKAVDRGLANLRDQLEQ